MPWAFGSLKFGAVSTIAQKVLELVRSLPPADQQMIWAELGKPTPGPKTVLLCQLQRLPDGTYYNPDGIPNDDPFFKILEEDQAASRQDFGPPAPEFD